MATPRRWNNVDEAIEDLMQKRDDFDSLALRLIDADWQVGETKFTGAYAEIHLCGGGGHLINPAIAEKLINDPRFQAMRIPVKLVPTRLNE